MLVRKCGNLGLTHELLNQNWIFKEILQAIHVHINTCESALLKYSIKCRGLRDWHRSITELKKNNSKLTNLKSMIALAISFPKKRNFILTFAI